MSTSRYAELLRPVSPTVLRYFAAVALVGFAVDGGIYAVLLNLYLVRLGLGPELIGLVNAAGTLSFALASLPAGLLGDRWSSRTLMLAGLGLMLAGSLLLPLADLLAEAARLPWLLAQMALLYLGLALFFVNTAPFVMSIVAGTQRTRVFSLQTALLSLAAFAGSLTGGLLPALIAAATGASLTEAGPFRGALFVAGLGLLVAMLVLRAARPELAPGAAGAPLGRGGIALAIGSVGGLLALIALARMLQVAGIAAMSTFFNVYLDSQLQVPTAQIGVIIALGRLLGAPAALATSALTGRFGNFAVVIGSTIASAICLLPLALIPHWGAAGFSFVSVIGISWIRYAASVVYFLELVPPTRRALVSGVTEMAAGICFTALAFGGGYLAARVGYRELFLLSTAITALSALVFWLAFRGRTPAAESGVASGAG